MLPELISSRFWYDSLHKSAWDGLWILSVKLLNNGILVKYDHQKQD